MEALKIALKRENLNWDYDEEADALYVSVGEPQAGVGLDVGDGVILRYKEGTKELIGIAILGVKARAAQTLHD
ncbi:MAG: DUF2283 domain-containing protein [Chloroherpetonaceae bacterium]|nr:DUF2283 domain-containing protein [Chloroherpetonaceae bacterium]MDW8436996.1 DUF2283 domain-containing protein [Chloroherpetonaceae bacterium]